MYGRRGAFTCQGQSRCMFIFIANLLQAFGVMGEGTHHLCLSRVHIHVMTCISHEMSCIRHFVDLTLFLQRHHDASFTVAVTSLSLHMGKDLLSF